MEEQKLYNGTGDPQFTKPYIDVDEWRDQPVRHHYIHGGFCDTLTKFCFYFPPEETYEKRFYQFLSPFVGDETEAQNQEGAENKISFAVLHGAYLIETNLGGIVNGGDDPTLMYRASASAAQYSRTVAAELYGEHRPYGYVYGGSGGAYKTISCMESTQGVWDGAVPFVIGSPMAMPYVFTARVHAMRLLRHRMEQIVDAIEPGGSGDPYAALNGEERDALLEATRMGFPLKTWCVWHTIGDGALPVLTPAVEQIDPTYYKDFWEQPGYLGTAEGSSAVRDRIRLTTTITELLSPQGVLKGIGDTIDEKNAYGVDEAWKNQLNKGIHLPYFRLAEFPREDPYLRGLKLTFVTGALAGQTFAAEWVRESFVTMDNSMDPRDLPALLEQVEVGDSVILDNSDYIALQTYHRHQVPDQSYTPWDQFRGDDGKPLYPQRPLLAGPLISCSGAGSIQSGTPHGKMIVLESLMDESAFPWNADWYRRAVEAHAGGKADDRFRLWYMDNCMHTDCEEGNGGDHQHIVSYLGALNQALLDIAAWVERDEEPNRTSSYRIDDGQVLIPETAAERGGIQPVVTLTVEGQKRIEVKRGETVVFHVQIELPEHTGSVEDVKWDYEGGGTLEENGFRVPEATEQMSEATEQSPEVMEQMSEATEQMSGATEQMSENTEQSPEATEQAFGDTKQMFADNRVCMLASHIYTKPGTYFAVVKAAANRTPGDPFTRVMNQDRVRVIVQA